MDKEIKLQKSNFHFIFKAFIPIKQSLNIIYYIRVVKYHILYTCNYMFNGLEGTLPSFNSRIKRLLHYVLYPFLVILRQINITFLISRGGKLNVKQAFCCASLLIRFRFLGSILSCAKGSRQHFVD